jgi:hypothetical protein
MEEYSILCNHKAVNGLKVSPFQEFLVRFGKKPKGSIILKFADKNKCSMN